MARQRTDDWVTFLGQYNAEIAVGACGDQADKLFPNLLTKANLPQSGEIPEEIPTTVLELLPAIEEASTAVLAEIPATVLELLPTIEEASAAGPAEVPEAELTVGRISLARKAKPGPGELNESYLDKQLAKHRDVKPPRQMEIQLGEYLKDIPGLEKVVEQPRDIPGLRPDILVTVDGKVVVVEAKHNTKSYIHKGDVEKMVDYGKAYDSVGGILYVYNKQRVSEDVKMFCAEQNIQIVEGNRKTRDNLRKAFDKVLGRTAGGGAGEPAEKPKGKDRAAKEARPKSAKKSGAISGKDKSDLPSTVDSAVPKKKDGTPDRRFKASAAPSDGAISSGCKPKSVDSGMSATPLKKDGTPDRRFKPSEAPPAIVPLKKDGTLDRGFKPSEAPLAIVPLKKDGTLDRRFKPSEAPPAIIPLKKDGTPDRRYKASEPAPASAQTGSKLKADGTPDMRYRANYTSSPVSSGRFSGSTSYAYNGNPSGPVTRSGLPDMRYSANRY